MKIKVKMKNINKPVYSSFWFLVLVLLYTLHFTPTTSQEVEDESEFNYVKGSEKGPENWGKIKKEWEACNNGDLQSPIDLSNKRVKIAPLFLGQLHRNYESSNATIKNRGHDIAVEWEGNAGSVRVNKTKYSLRQAHWHSPSEHTVNGRRYDLELHMVHASNKNKILVIALFYRLGRSDKFLSTLTEDLLTMIDKREEERKKGSIDPRRIKMKGFIYYKYLGSLTVPPCTQGVNWIIHKKISSVSSEQVQILRAAVRDDSEENARPLQPTNEREIALLVDEASITNYV